MMCQLIFEGIEDLSQPSSITDHGLYNTELNFQFFCPPSGPARLGESPVWDPVKDQLWWIDIEGNRLFCFDVASQETMEWPTLEIPGFVVLTSLDQPAIGMETGIFLFDILTASFELIVEFQHPGHRFNDATVDQNGRLFASTMSLAAEKDQAFIYEVTALLELRLVADSLTIPNGMVVDADRDLLYFSDSSKDVQSIWTLNLTEASAATPSLFGSTLELGGRPDGAALDSAGNYWIAGVDGSALYVFGPDGLLITSLSLPFSAPTKLAFWGDDERKIAVTSKGTDAKGGQLAIADLPADLPAGRTLAAWSLPQSMGGAA